MAGLKKIIFIVGPTAIGKSDVAVLLAKKINGEIISCDSMQVYQEISIATNKPTKDVLNSIPHHLVGIVSVKDKFDVATFNQLALKAIDHIHNKNKIPVIVGGSGMYVEILLDGIFNSDIKTDQLREQLKKRAEEEGLQSLYQELKTKDPEGSEKIHHNDARRIIRALEIVLTTNKKVSAVKIQREGLWGKFDISVYGLNMERKDLYKKIDERVENMLQNGLVEEVKALEGIDLSLTASVIIGIKEIKSYLKGENSLENAKELMARNTRHLAKKQLTWFRHEKRIQWIEIGQESTEDIVSRIADLEKEHYVQK
jgi:tRNA dimethylallyltransferase